MRFSKASSWRALKRLRMGAILTNLFHFRGFDIPVDLIQKTGAGPETFEQISDNHIALLQQYIGVKDTDHVMEIGCGIGRDAIPLAKLLEHGHYIGTDTIAPSIHGVPKT